MSAIGFDAPIGFDDPGYTFDGLPILPPSFGGFDFRLRAYEPGGVALGLLPTPLSAQASFVHNDDGALRIAYTGLAAGGPLLERGLEQGLEVAVEVSTGAGWVEPTGGRFLLLARDFDPSDAAQVVTLTLPSYSWLLRKALNLDTSNLLPADHSQAGKRAFLSANGGVIVGSVLSENLARGGIALTRGFTSSLDSDGQAWGKVATLYYDLGIDAWTILNNLALQGMVDWRTTARELNLYNPDEYCAPGLADSVFLRMGRDVAEAASNESLEDVVGRVLLRGEDGLTLTEENPSAPTPWGIWEGYISQGGVSDEGTARSLVQADLERGARLRGQYTRALIGLEQARHKPMVDYGPGAWITAPTTGTGERVRVQQVTLTKDANGVSGSLVLNDRVLDAELRRARRVTGIVGGSQKDGGSGVRPSPEGPDNRKPAKVVGLIVSTSAYIDTDGQARGQITAVWDQVTKDSNGDLLEVGSYDVAIRDDVVGAPWATVQNVDGLRADYSPLAVGDEILVRVRARASTTRNPGGWSDPFAVTIAADTTPPPVPSLPVVDSKAGVVTVYWNGQTALGAGMPADFSHVRVWTSAPYVGDILIGAIRDTAAGRLTYPSSRGANVPISLSAVDTSGNESARTAQVSHTVQGVQDGDLVGTALEDIATGAKQAADAAITETEIQYATHTSDTMAPTGGWSTTQPSRTPGTFIWMRTKITYGSGSMSYSTPVILTGPPGEKGDDGAGIEIVGTVATYGALPGGLGPSDAGKAYLVTADGKLYIWDGSQWPGNGAGVEFRGPTGSPGAPGATGSDGRGILSTTIHYQAATSATSAPTGTWLNNPPTVPAGDYLWTRTTIQYDSGPDSVSYAVSRQGEDGATGPPGVPGANGQTSYFHVAYATAADGSTGFSTTDASGKTYVGTYTDFTAADSTDPSDYTWQLVKGADGSPGTGVDTVTVRYRAGTSGTTPPGGTWTSSIPSVPEGRYLWTRTVTAFTDGASTTTYSVARQGEKGDQGNPGAPGSPGAAGVSVTSVVPYYRLVATKPAQPSAASPAGWSATEPSYSAGMTLWRAEKVTYSNGTHSWTPVTQVESYVVAANLQAHVDAGLMRVAPESNPPAPGKGLMWLVVDDETETRTVGLKVANSLGTGWGSHQLITEDLIVIGPGGAVRLANGVVTADAIDAGAVNAIHMDVRYEDDGRGVSIQPDGVRIYNADDPAEEPSVSLTASSTQWLSIVRDGEVVASISEDGQVTGKTLHASDQIYLAGESLEEILWDRPRGVVARYERSIAGWTLNATNGTPGYREVLELTTSVEAGRVYEFKLDPVSVFFPPDAYSYLYFEIYWTTNGTQPTRTNYQGNRYLAYEADSVGASRRLASMHGSRFYMPSSDHEEFRLLLLWQVRTTHSGLKTAEISSQVFAGQARLSVIDHGSRTFDDEGRNRTKIEQPTSGGGGSSSSGGGDAAPPRTRTVVRNSVGSRSYTGTGAIYSYAGSDVYQGYWLAMNGNLRGLWIFNSEIWDSDRVQGASKVEKIEVYVRNTHAAKNSGLTAHFFTHTHAALPATKAGTAFPNTWTVEFGKGEGQWVTLPAAARDALAARFIAGQAAGIGVYTTGSADYGRFAPLSQLRVTYRK